MHFPKAHEFMTVDPEILLLTCVQKKLLVVFPGPFGFHQGPKMWMIVLYNFSVFHVGDLIIGEWTNFSVIFVTAGKIEIGL